MARVFKLFVPCYKPVYLGVYMSRTEDKEVVGFNWGPMERKGATKRIDPNKYFDKPDIVVDDNYEQEND